MKRFSFLRNRSLQIFIASITAFTKCFIQKASTFNLMKKKKLHFKAPIISQKSVVLVKIVFRCLRGRVSLSLFINVFCIDVFCIDIFCIDIFCIDIFCIDIYCIDIFCIDIIYIDIFYIDIFYIDIFYIDIL